MNEHSRSAYRDLLVWQKSLDFANSVIDLIEELATERKHYRLVEQLEASAASVLMNIAEGKSGFHEKNSKVWSIPFPMRTNSRYLSAVPFPITYILSAISFQLREFTYE